MACRSPQLCFPVGGEPVSVPCGICHGCDVDRRLARRNRFFDFRKKCRNYGGSHV